MCHGVNKDLFLGANKWKKEEKSCIGFSEGFEISRLKKNNNNNNNNLPDKDERIFHLPVLIIKYDWLFYFVTWQIRKCQICFISFLLVWSFRNDLFFKMVINQSSELKWLTAKYNKLIYMFTPMKSPHFENIWLLTSFCCLQVKISLQINKSRAEFLQHFQRHELNPIFSWKV